VKAEKGDDADDEEGHSSALAHRRGLINP
jgi:hypothetical protein